MSEFWVTRVGDVLRCMDAESYAQFEKLPTQKPLHVEVRQPRNGAHHRLYWLLCHRIADAVGINSETVSDMLKIGTGHATLVRSKTNGLLRIPKSISFSAMDQTAFREFFERCILCICEEWSMERQDVLAAVEDLLVPTEQR